MNHYYVPMLEFRVGEVITAEVLVYTDLNDLLLKRLYANNTDFDDFFKKYSQGIQDFYASCDEDCIFVDEVTIGMPVAARFKQDKLWYRAEVYELTEDPNVVKVLFVDYGNREEVELKDLRRLLAKYHEYEIQIFRCKLHGIKYRNEKELIKATNFFYESTSEIFEKKQKTLKLTIKKIHGRSYSRKIFERLATTYYEVFIDYPIEEKILNENRNIFNLSFPAISVQTDRYLFFIRHGQYNENVTDNDKKSLTELGNIQADLVGKFMKELALKYNFMKLISSTMLRAIQTGSTIAKYFPELEFENDSSLNELHINNIKEENEQFQEAYGKYFRNGPKKKNNESLILVCHANLIRALTCKIIKRPVTEWNLFSLNHCSVTCFLIKNNEFSLLDFNNAVFLQNNQQTYI